MAYGQSKLPITQIGAVYRSHWILILAVRLTTPGSPTAAGQGLYAVAAYYVCPGDYHELPGSLIQRDLPASL